MPHPCRDEGLGSYWTANSQRQSQKINVPGVIDDSFTNSEGISNDFGASGASGTDSGLQQWNEFIQSNHHINEIMPLTTDVNADPFAGFDIPFWLGQDEYSGMVNEWN